MDVFDTKQFATKEELYAFIKENKQSLIEQKKAVFKEADGFMGDSPRVANKANEVDGNVGDAITKHIIINTTNILDSHGDVHVKGIWDRSLKHESNKLHLQEHKRGFDDVIAAKRDVNAYTLNTTFKALGYDIEGDTQSLIFESTIRKSKNEAMFQRYKDGEVDNHSVGMQYVNYFLAADSNEDWAKEEKAAWDEYYPMIANKEDADERGVFWVVKEAKVIEGSAVTMGSNPITGIYKNEPPQGTHNKGSLLSTLTEKDIINAFKLLK